MFINKANNNVSLFSVYYFKERGFYLTFFTFFTSKRGLYERRLEIYRRVPPAEDSVGLIQKNSFLS